jgi:hypothetical protein
MFQGLHQDTAALPSAPSLAMEVRMRSGLLVVLFVLSAIPAAAQNLVLPPSRPRTVNLSGPRFGMTSLSDGVVEKLLERGIEAPPMISQFGWQVEKAFFTADSGVAAVSEWVVLLGGLEQDVAIPSLTWLVGMRTANGAEFGVGPNITPAGTALAIAAGVTFRHGFVNIPMNVAIVPSKAGTRVSFLTGFNMRRR